MDGVRNVDAACFEQVRQLPNAVLRLGDSQAVARDDDDLAGVGELDGRIVDRDLADRAAHARERGLRALFRSEAADEDVGDGPVHGAGHQSGQNRTRGADQGAGNDQDDIADHEAGHRDGRAGEGVKQRYHDRHVGAADRKDHQHAEGECARQGHEQEHVENARVVGDDARAGEDEHDRDAQAADDPEPGQHPAAGKQDGPAPDEAHQLGRRNEGAGEGHRADDDVR